MSSQLITIILVILVGMVIFFIYSIVRIHDRALKLSKSENVEDYLQREKARLEMARKKIAREEKAIEEIREIEELAKEGLESELESEVEENQELLDKIEDLSEE